MFLLYVYIIQTVLHISNVIELLLNFVFKICTKPFENNNLLLPCDSFFFGACRRTLIGSHAHTSRHHKHMYIYVYLPTHTLYIARCVSSAVKYRYFCVGKIYSATITEWKENDRGKNTTIKGNCHVPSSKKALPLPSILYYFFCWIKYKRCVYAVCVEFWYNILMNLMTKGFHSRIYQVKFGKSINVYGKIVVLTCGYYTVYFHFIVLQMKHLNF